MSGDAIKLAPSIPAADFARLGEQVAEAERSFLASRRKQAEP
jgi:pentose-5-phosphate-3-epimerase